MKQDDFPFFFIYFVKPLKNTSETFCVVLCPEDNYKPLKIGLSTELSDIFVTSTANSAPVKKEWGCCASTVTYMFK